MCNLRGPGTHGYMDRTAACRSLLYKHSCYVHDSTLHFPHSGAAERVSGMVIEKEQTILKIKFPSRNCFSPWTWSQYPPNPPKAASQTRQVEKRPLLHIVSRITGSSPSQRLVKIRSVHFWCGV
ncbi:unnamed protein product [Caretta caretta]